MHTYKNNIPGFWSSRCKGPEARVCLAVGVAAKGLMWLEWNECGWRGGKWKEIIPMR